VLGGGTMGTAAGWALARRGVSCVVLEQFQHVHTMGSHGGKTRIFRHAYAEGGRYVPWTLEADRLWGDLQQRTGASIMHRIGCIDVSAPGFHRARDAYQSAQAYSIEAEWLDGAEVNRRWPIWKLPEDREVCFGPQAGYLNVANGLNALASEFRAAGGVLHDNTPVVSWSASDSGVEVTTTDGVWTADRLIISAGAWAIHQLRDLGVPLEVRRKPVLWFEVDAQHAAQATPDAMPVFISDDTHGEFYGIPEADQAAVKVGMHSGGEASDPNTLRREVDEGDSQADIWPFINRSLHGFTGKVVDSSVCMYTMTPDEDFVLDRHPEWNRVVVAAGFSGHGFKFTPVIGECLADLATRPDREPIADFTLGRFVRSGIVAS
jgi:monomeric sarcosine oxidase